MIRLRIREFNLEVIKPKLWEAGVLLALGVFGWIAYAYLRGDGAPKIPCQQDRAKNAGARDYIENSADEQDDPNTHNRALGVPELNGRLHDKGRLHQFHDTVHKHEQYR